MVRSGYAWAWPARGGTRAAKAAKHAAMARRLFGVAAPMSNMALYRRFGAISPKINLILKNSLEKNTLACHLRASWNVDLTIQVAYGPRARNPRYGFQPDFPTSLTPTALATR